MHYGITDILQDLIDARHDKKEAIEIARKELAVRRLAVRATKKPRIDPIMTGTAARPAIWGKN